MRGRAVALAVTAVVVGVWAAPVGVGSAAAADAPAEVPDGVYRAAGSDRIETAVALSRRAFRTADTVLIARADTFPDALAAPLLADVLDAPLLLTPSDELHPATAREIGRLQASEAVVLGGDRAIAPTVVDDLARLGLTTRRLQGPTRADTAAAIARAAADELGGVEHAVLARADDFPDALSASSLAIAAQAPVLLTGPAGLDPAAGAALDELLAPGDQVWLAGGTRALSEAVFDDVVAAGFVAERLAGPDRYGTASELNEAAVSQPGWTTPDRLLLASGVDFPDALAAGPAVAALRAPLMIVPPDDVGPGPEFLTTMSDRAGTVVVAGGPAAVSDRVLTQVDERFFGDATTVFHGGPIVTMDGADVEAVAVRDERIVRTGPLDSMPIGPATEVIDLDGRALLPGFVDAHGHWLGDNGNVGDTVDEAVDRVVANGYTTIAELYVHPPRIETLTTMDEQSRLPIRVEAFLPLRTPQGDVIDDGYWDPYVPYEMLSEHVRASGIKLHLDWLGTTNYTVGEITDLIGPLHDRGWTIALHGLQRETAVQALDALEGLLDGAPNAWRHRIEHLLLLQDATLERLADSGIVASVQIGGTSHNWVVVDETRAGLVDGNEDEFARWRDLDDAGARMVGSTDSPWFFFYDQYPDSELPPGTGQIFRMLHGTVTGEGNLGGPVPDWLAAQTLDVERAMELMTVDAAWALDREWEIGRIRPGFLADLVVASGDPRTASLAELDTTDVLVTMAGGQSVHCADPAALCPRPFPRGTPP